MPTSTWAWARRRTCWPCWPGCLAQRWLRPDASPLPESKEKKGTGQGAPAHGDKDMHTILRRKTASALVHKALIAIVCIASGAAGAQTAFPHKPVKLVVGFAAGGSTDVVARPFVGHNSPAPTPTRAAGAVAGAPADGYTLLFGATNHTMIPGLYAGRVKFDAVKSFKPLCTVATSPTVLV